MTSADFSNQLADAVQAASAWTVRVQARRGPPASGIVIGPDLVLTTTWSTHNAKTRSGSAHGRY
jgi:hypothetical protein